MPNPAKLSFALPSFDAFKNYDRKTITITISGTVGANNTITYSGSTTLSRDNSITSVGFTTSANSNLHGTSQTYLFLPETVVEHSDGSTATFPGSAAYSIIFINEFSGNDVTITARIGNPYMEVLTPIPEVLSFTLYTFIAPFTV